MILLTINIRGMGRRTKWKYLHDILGKEKPDILCVQETKLLSLSDTKCFSLWGNNEI